MAWIWAELESVIMSMLERAARAVHADWIESFNHGRLKKVDQTWEELDESQKRHAFSQARAVLMAVREPDDTMHDRGDKLRYSGAANYGAGDIFTAMIDSILNETPE